MIKLKNINEKYLAQIEARIDEVLDDTPKAMKSITNHLKNAKGKNIRSAFIVAVAEAINGDVAENIIDFAVAIELLHLSTLIHDDIIDGAIMRRGVESVQHKFGKKLAVLSGDYLFTKCFRLIAEKNKDRTNEFAKAVSAICVGEILQHQNNKNYDITKQQYYKIIAGKTAAMFVLAMYGAAIESCADEITSGRMARAGYNIGMVFQMVDDLLDLDGDTKKTKKTILKDLEEGIVTFPLIHALSVDDSLKKIIAKEKLSGKDLGYITDKIRLTGGIEATRIQAKVFYDRALSKIEKALYNKNTSGLIELIELVYNRDI